SARTVISATQGCLRFLILILGFSTLAYAGKNQFVSFDFPGSTDTEATAITPSGEIVGRYFSADGRQHGFVLSKGVLSSLDVPGSVFTDAAWVNARGDIVGSYVLPGELGQGYVLSNGTFTTIDFPANGVDTAGFGISNAGDVVGVGFDPTNFLGGRGYLFRHGQFTIIDFPGAQGTFPTMVIDSGRIVGAYADTTNALHGFLLSGGTFSTIDVPNSTLTWITGISPKGDIVG